jgi:hypothetical protein
MMRLCMPRYRGDRRAADGFRCRTRRITGSRWRLLLAGAIPFIAIAPLVGCDVRNVDWGNATYTVTCPGLGIKPTTVRLVRGQASVPPNQPFGLHVRLATSLTADVTGDGRVDQVLLLGCSTGGSGFATEVQVFADGPRLLARLPAPPVVPSAYFSPQFEKVWVSAGRLQTVAQYWAPDDCHFCASIHLSITWRWTGHSFVVANWHRL